MADDKPTTMTEAERQLARLEERSKALEKEITEAEAKVPPKPDHANDGGIF